MGASAPVGHEPEERGSRPPRPIASLIGACHRPPPPPANRPHQSRVTGDAAYFRTLRKVTSTWASASGRTGGYVFALTEIVSDER
jgi:hypothetical protein